MEYMMKFDPFYVDNKESKEHSYLDLYYEAMDNYFTRIMIVFLWTVYCFFIRPNCCWRSGGTQEGDRRSHMSLRYALVYGVFSWFSHVMLLFHHIFDYPDYSEVCVALRTLFIFFFLTSIFLRTALVLYVYSRMELALAGYIYHFENLFFCTVCCGFCVILALCISSIVILTPLPFQVVVDVDRCNLILASFLLILILRVLLNDVYKLIGMGIRLHDVFIVFLYALFAPFLYVMYSSYSNLACDVVFNLQIILISTLCCPDETYDDDIINVPRDLAFPKPFVKSLEFFLVPMPLSPGPSSANSSRHSDDARSASPS